MESSGHSRSLLMERSRERQALPGEIDKLARPRLASGATLL